MQLFKNQPGDNVSHIQDEYPSPQTPNPKCFQTKNFYSSIMDATSGKLCT